MSKFKGFDEVGNLTYNQRVFKCSGCDNQCDVTEIKTDDGKFFAGDRCERFSGIETHLNCIDREAEAGKNPFDEREEILESYKNSEVKGRVSVGIPRIGMFYELFPLWSTFFNELNINLVCSSKTSKKVIMAGLEKTTGDFCFPYKVAFGHVAGLDTEYIFIPDIIEGYATKYLHKESERETGWDKSRTCPYLSKIGPIVARNASGKKVINPVVDFRDDKKMITRDLSLALRDAGLEFSKREIRSALVAGEDSYFEFKRRVRDKGKEVLDLLKNKSRGIVIVSRPYSAFDEEMNLRLAKKISNYGFLPVPMDFLPLPDKDLSETWGNEFSVQGQLVYNAAESIKNLGMNAVFVDYFGCGSNSFIRHFFERQLGKPYLTLQIDEHTADAGMVTRMEAFLDSLG